MRNMFGTFLPCLLAFGFTLVLYGATPLIAPTSALPNVAILMVMFWGLYRPVVFPYPVVLLLGLMIDVLSGQPLGTEACILLIVRLVIELRLRAWAERPFVAQWLLVAVLLAFALMGKGILQELYLKQSISWTRLTLVWLLSVLIYPLLHMLCSWVYLALPQSSGPRGGALPRPTPPRS